MLTKVPLAGSYLQLVENQPGGLGVIDVPHLDAGPFLSYGIQWISFGILAPIGLGYFAYSEIRARRQTQTTGVVGRNPDDRRGETRPTATAATVECAPEDFQSALTAGKPRLSRPTCTLNATSAHSIARPVAPRSPACTIRDSATARRRSATGGVAGRRRGWAGSAARADTAWARPAARPAPRRRPPRRPRRWGWDDGPRRGARPAPHPTAIRRPAVRRAPPAPRSPAQRHSWPDHPIVLRPNRIGYSAASGGRSSRPAC